MHSQLLRLEKPAAESTPVTLPNLAAFHDWMPQIAALKAEIEELKEAKSDCNLDERVGNLQSDVILLKTKVEKQQIELLELFGFQTDSATQRESQTKTLAKHTDRIRKNENQFVELSKTISLLSETQNDLQKLALDEIRKL